MARLPTKAMVGGTLVDNYGNALIGHLVYVRQHGEPTPVPIYQDDSSGVTFKQPVETGPDGTVPGFIETPIDVDVIDAATGKILEQPYMTVDDLAAVWTTANAHTAAKYATTAALHASNYAAGPPATMTSTATGALSVDGFTPSVSDRILVKNEVAQEHNGIYTVTVVGDGSNAWTLTRATDMASSGQIPGAYLWVTNGTANGGAGFIVASPGPFTIGSTAIPWGQFSIVAGATALLAANNLSDVTDVLTARANLLISQVGSCKAVATTNITLSGTQTIDDIALIAGDRVLLTGQNTGSQNGPFVVAAGAWARPNDYKAAAVIASRMCAVLSGTVNHATLWQIDSAAGVTVDTTATTWVKIAAPVAAKVVRQVHTFAVAGPIAVPSGGGADLANYIPPFFVSLGANETAKIVKARYMIGTGTSATCKLTKNGSDITGFTGLVAATAPAQVTPTGVAVAENDIIAVVVTGVSASPGNLSMTVVIEKTIS